MNRIIITLFICATTHSQHFLPLTLIISGGRDWHTPRTTTHPGQKISQIKLSPESGHITNVTFGIEPSYHDDVSRFFRVDGEGGGVYVREEGLEGWQKPTGFLQLTATAPGRATSKVEVRVNFDDTKTTPQQRRPPWAITTAATTTINSISMATTPTTTTTTSMTTTTTTTPPSQQPQQSTTIIITTIIIVLIMITIGIIFLFVYLKKRSRKILTKEKPHPQPSQPRALSNRYEEADPKSGGGDAVDPWAVPRHKLKILGILGEGCFGQVWRAEFEGTTVAVKTLKESASERDRLDLLSELQVLKSLEPHPNVVRLLGCCVDDPPTSPPLLLLEYVPLGKLQSYLRSSRDSSSTNTPYSNLHPSSTHLTSQNLTSFSLQVAKGMDYLSRKGIIHRDLAARNVLLDGDGVTCKVADFGFARDVLGVEGAVYERKVSDGRLPIRWMAPESLYDSIFTTKSDVWSFGVLMWEIVTLGSTPYPGMSPATVMRLVSHTPTRLEKPLHCKRELYNIMFYCWAHNPEDRPSFSDLTKFLGGLIEQDEDYIQLDLFPEHGYCNLEQEEEQEEKV